ncbi:YidB family protein [Methylobacterium sp. WSM2598]|uniref:YidB family protein n=1 Tax=Methylobacterium sp. WSM2598 TaxID=398261 RepID=UPI0003AA7254|nr:YidB family protein [Methylobacterium sp. WSM2598]
MSRGYPSMTALLGLLALAGYQNRDKIAEMLGGAGQGSAGSGAGTGSGQTGLGGLLGNLTGSLGGASAGGLLSGGLSELVDRFRQNGHGEAADSWVRQGPNQEMAPHQLQQAIGPEVLDTLARQTGLSHDELLARLSRELPSAVDRYTPEGQLPAH